MNAGVPTDGDGPNLQRIDNLEPPQSVVTAYQFQHCGGVGVGGGEMRCCGAPMARVDRDSPVEEPEFADVLRDVLGMSGTELEICIDLMREGPMTAGEVADRLDIANSFANRLLNHLVELEVVEERSYLLKEGGRVSRYNHADIADVEEAFKRELAVWIVEALGIIEESIVEEKDTAIENAQELADKLGENEIYYEDS
jgi:predicted transcriptional regulator